MCFNKEFGSLCNLNRDIKKVDSIPTDMIVAGKNTYVYDAHTYHTKVPPEGIEILIKHFTNEQDVVLDPFCGSGMTGVAAQRLNRKVLLSDISPAATFIAKQINTLVDADEYMAAINKILEKSSVLNKKLYTTTCRECGKETQILYTVWSYRLVCDQCNKDFLLWDVARKEGKTSRESKILTEFNCPHCGNFLKKRKLKRLSLEPVAIGYKCCTKSLKEKCCSLIDSDMKKIGEITYKNIPASLWYPQNEFYEGVNTRQPLLYGITSVDKAYFPRALWAFSYLWDEASRWEPKAVREKLIFTLTSLYQRITKFSEFRFWGGSGNIANYNVPQIINEQNVFLTFERKAKTIYLYLKNEHKFDSQNVQISTQSACRLSQLKDNSIDYVFTDPPFGSNINYSEMNYLWESWLKTYTDIKEEAIINKFQGKDKFAYGELMTQAWKEIYRVLKKDAWLTILFHNSSSAIWDELQKSIYNAGFCINGSMLFDKKHGTFKQFVSHNAVGFDLAICCQKKVPSSNLSVCLFDDTEKLIKNFANYQ